MTGKESTKLIDQSFLKQNVNDAVSKPSGQVDGDHFEGFTYQGKKGGSGSSGGAVSSSTAAGRK